VKFFYFLKEGIFYPLFTILIILILLFEGCVYFKLKIHPKIESDKIISKNFSKHSQNYKILYRNLNYLSLIRDSNGFDISNFKIVNNEGFQLDLINYSQNIACSEEMSYQIISKLKPNLNELSISNKKIDTLLYCLSDIYGNRYTLTSKYKYYIFSDWSTYMLKRQKKLLKKWQYLLNDSSVCFLLINKDFFIQDTLTSLIKKKAKIRTNFKY
jgi:hypothetical protein